mmetsp:Transcript_15614/g.36178  ORF Transcript_15614/g.36178 Transcript_15614/m.36178 type:complete len:207 (-) Transcript_15614:835-1455(-)
MSCPYAFGLLVGGRRKDSKKIKSYELHAAVDEARDSEHVSLVEAARGERGRAHADAAGDERALVAGDGVLVERDGRLLQHSLHTRAIDSDGLEVNEEQMVVRAAGDNRVAFVAEGLCKNLAVAQHRPLVLRELRRRRLLERDGERGDGVVVRAALVAGEHGSVDRLLEVVHQGLSLLVKLALPLAVKDHRTARAAQRLMRRRGDHV